MTADLHSLRLQAAWAVAWIVMGLGLDWMDRWDGPPWSPSKLALVTSAIAIAWAACSALTGRGLAQRQGQPARGHQFGLVAALAYSSAFLATTLDFPFLDHFVWHFLATGLAAAVAGTYLTVRVASTGFRVRPDLGKVVLSWGTFAAFEYAAILMLFLPLQFVAQLLEPRLGWDLAFAPCIAFAYGLAGFFASGVAYRSSKRFVEKSGEPTYTRDDWT